MHLSTDWIGLSDRKLTVWRVQRSWIGSYQAKKKNQLTKHMMTIPTTRCLFVFWGLVWHAFVPFVLLATVAGRKSSPCIVPHHLVCQTHKVTYYTNSEVYANSSTLTCATFCSCAHTPTCTRAKKKSTGGTRFTKRANMA